MPKHSISCFILKQWYIALCSMVYEQKSNVLHSMKGGGIGEPKPPFMLAKKRNASSHYLRHIYPQSCMEGETLSLYQASV